MVTNQLIALVLSNIVAREGELAAARMGLSEPVLTVTVNYHVDGTEDVGEDATNIRYRDAGVMADQLESARSLVRKLEDQLRLKPGQPLSTEAIEHAQQCIDGVCCGVCKEEREVTGTPIVIDPEAAPYPSRSLLDLILSRVANRGPGQG